MTGRERVLAALQHKEPDRVPLDLGGTESSGMTAYSLKNLCQHLGLAHTPKVFEPMQYVAYIPDEICERFGVDTANLTPEPCKWSQRKNPAGFDVLLPGGWMEHVDENNNTLIKDADNRVVARRPNGGLYFDPVNPLLQDLEAEIDLKNYTEQISAFDWPSFMDEGIEALTARARRLHAQGRCVVFNLCCHLLAATQILRGFENSMMDMLTEPDLFRCLQKMLLEAYDKRINLLAPKLKPYVDVVLLNDDLGFQDGPMLSPDLYRNLVKPFQRELFAQAKQAFDAPLLFHSCGSIREFIPDLIEIGVDALNPVQVSARGMDPAQLKRDFGRDLTFWGGGIDTQNVLNRATPNQVRDAVKRTIEILAPGGGFVFTQVHNIQPDVPPENICAMFDALQEYGENT